MTNRTETVGGLFDVSDGHSLYLEEHGNGDVAAIFLHGGPGSGFRPRQRNLFDPERHRAILFDQRGAGRSRPKRMLEHNTTQHLIADMEAIRISRGIERWLVVGGSWGATLALAYAEAHPERVLGIALRAVFLGTRAELDWAFIEGCRRIRPDLYRDFVSVLPKEERDDPLPAYWRRILDPDPAVHLPATWGWFDAERILSEVNPLRSRIETNLERLDPLPTTPLFESHYFSNNCFLEPDQLLNNAGRLAGIHGIIIQGRYDLLCPPSTSAKLVEAWPSAEIRYIENAGHAMTEPGVANALQAAISDLTNCVQP